MEEKIKAICKKDRTIFQKGAVFDRITVLNSDPCGSMLCGPVTFLGCTDCYEMLFTSGNGRYYFGGGDPQFVIESLPKNTGKLYIEIEVMKESEAQEAFWMSFSRISAEKDKEIQKLKHQISEMENTKAWKLYRSIKKK